MEFKTNQDNQTDNNDLNLNIRKSINAFIESLEKNSRPEDSKDAFDKVVQVMTLEAFSRIKVIDDKLVEITSQSDQKKLESEKSAIKEGLVKSVTELAMLADSYKQEG